MQAHANQGRRSAVALTPSSLLGHLYVIGCPNQHFCMFHMEWYVIEYVVVR
jgi:hypothetical protein